MTIDLVRLCASCGVRLIHANATGLDLEKRRLLLQDRTAVNFDLLSIASARNRRFRRVAMSDLSIKPMQTFLSRLRSAIEESLAENSEGELEIAIVGGGAAGVEVACCLQEYYQREFPAVPRANFTLIEASANVLDGMPAKSQRLAQTELSRRGIRPILGSRVVETRDERTLVFENGEQIHADLVIWATSARPSPLLGQLDLPRDERGFLLTRDTLQSVGSDEVFIVGDAGTVQNEDYAKAGVYAVRQAPVLWNNLRRKLEGQQLERWVPQQKFLSLIGTGDDRAILTYHNLSLHNAWSWKLKDWIRLAIHGQVSAIQTAHDDGQVCKASRFEDR